MDLISAASPNEQHCAGYWRESARPLVSLAFVAPLLILYEGGTLLFGAQAARNGADYWLRSLLDSVGFGQYFLLPALACGLLLAAHHAKHEPWRLGAPTIAQMWLEAAGWGMLLLITGNLLFWLLAGEPTSGANLAAATLSSSQGLAPRLVGYLGAGIYEELLFRLLLIPPLVALLRTWKFKRQASLMIAAALTSVCFAAAHYQMDASLFGWQLTWPYGEPFAPVSFAFRFAAGTAFALLFSYRGFGIVVGAHALYDLLVLCLS
jgi:membrane protease YdiL (CAAX protease family)